MDSNNGAERMKLKSGLLGSQPINLALGPPSLAGVSHQGLAKTGE